MKDKEIIEQWLKHWNELPMQEYHLSIREDNRTILPDTDFSASNSNEYKYDFTARVTIQYQLIQYYHGGQATHRKTTSLYVQEQLSILGTQDAFNKCYKELVLAIPMMGFSNVIINNPKNGLLIGDRIREAKDQINEILTKLL